MSFSLTLSKIVDSADMIVAPGAVISAEGQALVRQPGAMSAGVMPSTAATANEVFVGFSMAGTSAAPFPEAFTNKVETLVVPSTGTVTLQRTPVTGQVFVFDNTTGAAVPTPTVVGNTITGLTVGDEVAVTYKFPLSVNEARAIFGDVEPGGYAGAYVGQVGVAKRGLIYLGEFDASKNWEAATAIKLAANGQVTDQSGAGATIVGAYVVATPNTEYPFLGIEFSAA